jgi:hypothetical protein
VSRDPVKEPRALAVGIWTLFGLLAGAAVGIATSSFPLPQILLGLAGLAYGLFTTRRLNLPEDD